MNKIIGKSLRIYRTETYPYLGDLVTITLSMRYEGDFANMDIKIAVHDRLVDCGFKPHSPAAGFYSGALKNEREDEFILAIVFEKETATRLAKVIPKYEE